MLRNDEVIARNVEQSPTEITLTIEEAKKLFVSGKDNIQKVLSTPLHRNFALRDNGSKRDSNIPYDASIITPTLVAATIPTSDDLGMFIQSLLINPKCTSRKIIALGKHQGSKFDFYNFCTLPRAKQNFESFDNKFFLTIQNVWPNKFWKPESIFQTNLRITAIPLLKLNSKVAPHMPIFLEADVTFIKTEKCILQMAEREMGQYFELYQQTREQNTIVCADAASISGQLIFSFEILKNHQQLFGNTDPVENAQQVIELLSTLRKDRPGLVGTLEQFEAAIINANKLYQYSLRHAKLMMPKIYRSLSEPSPASGSFPIAAPQIALPKDTKFYGLFMETMRRNSLSEKRMLQSLDKSISTKMDNAAECPVSWSKSAP